MKAEKPLFPEIRSIESIMKESKEKPDSGKNEEPLCSCGFAQSVPIPHEHDRTEREARIIKHFRDALASSEARIKELEQKITFQNDLHLDYCRALKDRDKQLTEKEREIADMQKEMDDLNKSHDFFIDNCNKRNRELIAENERLKKENEDIQTRWTQPIIDRKVQQALSELREVVTEARARYDKGNINAYEALKLISDGIEAIDSRRTA